MECKTLHYQIKKRSINMDYYIVIDSNKLYYKNTNSGNRIPLTICEAYKIIVDYGLNISNIINISNDILKHGVNDNDNDNDKKFLSEEQYIFKLWYSSYIEDNLNNFPLPIFIENDIDYILELERIFENYKAALNVIAFKYRSNLLQDVKQICDTILNSFHNFNNGNEDYAQQLIHNLIKSYMEDSFFVSSLSNSYAFRGVAPFIDLHSPNYGEKYAKMMNTPLTFYRSRTSADNDNSIKSIKDMLHLPFKLRDKASKTRFSNQSNPCLYLGVTSYVCAKECNYNEKNQQLYTSLFLPSKDAYNLKILNLIVSQGLINGAFNRLADGDDFEKEKLQNSMLKIFPLVIATSFTIKNKNENIRSEYIISQLLMNVASELNIDGIAYLSRQVKNDFQYPQGVNLVIPCTDTSKEKQYSKYCRMFSVSKPVLFADYTSEKFDKESYINSIYLEKNRYDSKNFSSTICQNNQFYYYGKTRYGIYDNYLVSKSSLIIN